jgi:hypothetical protein
MQIIKNIKYDIYQFAPITVNCSSYSTLLEVTIKLTMNGLKLDVSYLEDVDIQDDQKKYHFLIKRVGDYISEGGYSFYRMFDMLVSNTVERYYVFYREDVGEEENREKKLNQLGI